MRYIVLGASRGLGAALVDELLEDGREVIALYRSPEGDVARHGAWEGTGRYRYVRADLADPACRETLVAVRDGLAAEPACVIVNAACIESDVKAGGGFDRGAYERVSLLAVTSLGLVLDVFGEHLTGNRGMLVGISSLSALVPPVLEPRIAYPASKAFLTMAFRSLRVLWHGRAKVVTVMLGHVGDRRFPDAPRWLIPSYRSAARTIVRRITGRRVPATLWLPLPVCMLYRFASLFPDRLSVLLFRPGRTFVSSMKRKRPS